MNNTSFLTLRATECHRGPSSQAYKVEGKPDLEKNLRKMSLILTIFSTRIISILPQIKESQCLEKGLKKDRLSRKKLNINTNHLQVK